MKKLSLIGVLAAFAALAAMAVGASAASAAPSWWEDGAATAKAVAVTSTATLYLTDAKGGAFGGSVTVRCTGTDTGYVGARNVGKSNEEVNSAYDEITGITVTSCEHYAGETCESANAEPDNLPWHTELYEESGEKRDRIQSSGAGTPGWTVHCTVFGITEADECLGELSTAMVNVSPNVEAIFDEKSGAANCSRGGTGSGGVTGSDLIEAPSGHTIDVN